MVATSDHHELGVQRARLLERLQDGNEVAGRRAHLVHGAHDRIQARARTELEHVAAIFAHGHLAARHHRGLAAAERVRLADLRLLADGDPDRTMSHGGGTDLHVGSDDDRAGARVDDNACRGIARCDLEGLDGREPADALRRVERRAHGHRARIQGIGRARAEVLVHRLRDTRGRGEVGRIEVEHEIAALVEGRGHAALDARATGNAAAGGNVHLHAGTALALRTDTADHDAALRDRVDLAIGTLQRRHQQFAATDALRVTDGSHGHVDALTGLGERRQLGGDGHGGGVLQLRTHVGRHVHAELLEHVLQALRRERSLARLVATAVETHDQAIADQLVAAHAPDLHQVADTVGVRGHDGAQRQHGDGAAEDVAKTMGDVHQNGIHFESKKRDNQPRVFESASVPLPTYSMRASATRLDATMLSLPMSCGRTMPEMRTSSSPWLIVSHFSPRTTSAPLDRRCATVTVISPLSWLLCSLEPSPANALLLASELSAVLPPILRPWPSSVGEVMVLPFFLLVLVAAFLLACVASTSVMVRMSPMRCARGSANSSIDCWSA